MVRSSLPFLLSCFSSWAVHVAKQEHAYPALVSGHAKGQKADTLQNHVMIIVWTSLESFFEVMRGHLAGGCQEAGRLPRACQEEHASRQVSFACSHCPHPGPGSAAGGPSCGGLLRQGCSRHEGRRSHGTLSSSGDQTVQMLGA